MEVNRTLAGKSIARDFGRYGLVRRIAFGGMAEVYLAQLNGTASFSKLVVVKLVLPQFAEDPEFLELFLDEGHLAARLSHPNIAQTFEMGEADGRLYIAMEYVSGEALSTVLRRAKDENKSIPLQFSLHVMLELLAALEYAHSQKDDEGWPLYIVHRDVSPSNVMVTYEGTVKLVDFGIARAVSQKHKTQLGLLKGKPAYMAPEQQVPGPIDRRADIFSAGTILYELCTGDRAFDQDTPLELLNAVQLARFREPRSVDPNFPEALEGIILKAMARLPDERYQTASKFRDELGIFASSIGMFPGQGEFGVYMRELFEQQRSGFAASKAEGPWDSTSQTSLVSPGHVPLERIETGDILTNTVRPDQNLLQRSTPSIDATVLAQSTISDEGKIIDGEASIELKPSIEWPRILGWVIAMAACGIAVSLGVKSGSKLLPPPVATSEFSTPPRELVASTAINELIKEREGVDPKLEPLDSQSLSQPTKQSPARTKRIAPRAMGNLKLDCDSPAQVIENGRLLGMTPLEMALPAGEHNLLLQNHALGKKKTVKLMIVDGEVTRYFVNL